MKFDAVLFDCDGVLVDSEPITNGVLRDMLAELGWHLDVQTCMDIFVGKAVLEPRVQAIPRALLAVDQIHAAYAGRIACGSGADLPKVLLQMRRVGLLRYFEGRVFSGHDLPRSKPHPDVYWAAAAALGGPASACAVVEDTPTGIAAGVAAGATVLGYAPQGQGDVLLRAGASQVFADMAELPGLLV